jgi:D-alanine transaminase
MALVYINGEYLPPEQARISPFDRGFLFGDGIYEVIPVFGGKPFRFKEHFDRLDKSLSEIGMRNPLTREQWQDIFSRLCTETGTADQSIYLQITRDHRFPENVTPTVFAYSKPLNPPPVKPHEGITCITASDWRWQRCDIKSISLLGSVLPAEQAARANAREAILIRDGIVWEGASSNVFAVIDGVLRTAPIGRYLLGGITRDVIVELMEQNPKIAFTEKAFTEAEMRRASEVWISSSTREILPVTTLDGMPVGNGQVGDVYKQVWNLYVAFRQSF